MFRSCKSSFFTYMILEYPTHTSFLQAHQAYTSNNGAEASSLSAAGKQHQSSAAAYNKQASDYIFLQNNSASRVPTDTIDLHGQFVDEAEAILETRIRTAKAQGQTHLHVIVGKGNHSPGHIQKIKPVVERICQEEGLQFSTEANAGRIYVNLQGGEAHMPAEHEWSQGYSGGGYGQQGQQQQQQYGQGQQQAWQQQGAGYQYQPQAQAQPQYGQYGQQQQHQQQQGQGQNQQQQQQMEMERMEQSAIRACLRACCTVM